MICSCPYFAGRTSNMSLMLFWHDFLLTLAVSALLASRCLTLDGISSWTYCFVLLVCLCVQIMVGWGGESGRDGGVSVLCLNCVGSIPPECNYLNVFHTDASWGWLQMWCARAVHRLCWCANCSWLCHAFSFSHCILCIYCRKLRMCWDCTYMSKNAYSLHKMNKDSWAWVSVQSLLHKYTVFTLYNEVIVGLADIWFHVHDMSF